MKLQALKTAAQLAHQIQIEENNDTRMPNTDGLKKRLANTGISSTDAALFAMMEYRYDYSGALTATLKAAELEVYKNFLNAYGALSDKEKQTRSATRAYELSAELEV